MVERGKFNVRGTAPIRLTKNDREEYARLARNTKAKVSRTNKNYGLDLSEQFEIPSLNDFKTRSEYNQWKQKVSSFTKRTNQEYQFFKNEKGVALSKGMAKRFERNLKKAQRLADKKAQALAQEDFFVNGKAVGKLGQQMDQMGKPLTPGISRPNDVDINNIESFERLQKLDEQMKNRSNPKYFDKRNEKMKRVFERELEENFNSDAQDLLELLEFVPADDFYYLYLKHKEFDYKLFYPPEGVEDDGSSLKDVKAMENVLKDYWAGNENFDMKGF